ncbi:hypothetical protein [Aliiruegeria lutimaris]|uniref:Uncharacterized protein n=1 Tax=Aliiruegeria lutimaris TaxID=571298 RepID=A0A1G8TJ89_9RHOB|nr:hypothetical protein [Aliiruegeria lutimaris]SDJ41632.1 hypothetical protein SAMN04488026_101723 [Aliiruegeria lutimaris]
MPPKTFIILLVAVIMLAAVTVGVAAVFWRSIAPWAGLVFVVLIGLKLLQARHWPGPGKEDK